MGTNNKENDMNTKAKPVHEIRLGKIRAAVWGNRNADGNSWHSVTFARRYRDKEGNYRDADSFGAEDLPVLREVAGLVLAWCLGQDDAAQQAEKESD
jgi:hypothetical protein